MKDTAESIIEAFDTCVSFYWGKKRERVNRHDAKHAKEWLQRGVTLTLCIIVFTRQLEKMFNDEKEPPTSIGYIGDDVFAAIDRSNGNYLDDWEKDISKWRARVRLFKENGGWCEWWGEKPPKNPLIPKKVLIESGYLMR